MSEIEQANANDATGDEDDGILGAIECAACVATASLGVYVVARKVGLLEDGAPRTHARAEAGT